jgi:serine/threonine protein kinase
MGLKSINPKKIHQPLTQDHSLEKLEPKPLSPLPVEAPDPEPEAKDEFHMTKSMRIAISQKFKIIQLIGKGSYGCVSKAKCLETGNIVALKVMQNNNSTEYEFIKLLREIKIMRELNEILSDSFNDHNPFVP